MISTYIKPNLELGTVSPDLIKNYDKFVSPRLREVARHLFLVESELFDSLQEYQKGWSNVNLPLCEYSSALLKMYESSDEFLKIRNELLSGNKKADELLTSDARGEISSRLLNGKRIFEAGCRGGLFLRFCRHFGAEVSGLTDERYYQGAKVVLDEPNIFLGFSSQISDDVSNAVRSINPDYFISLNLLNTDRVKQLGDVALILSSWTNCAGPQTKFILVPNVDFLARSIIDSDILLRFSPQRFTGTSPLGYPFVLTNFSCSSSKLEIPFLAGREERSFRYLVYEFKLKKL